MSKGSANDPPICVIRSILAVQSPCGHTVKRDIGLELYGGYGGRPLFQKTFCYSNDSALYSGTVALPLQE